jgi:hypothetical protein
MVAVAVMNGRPFGWLVAGALLLAWAVLTSSF